MRRFSLYLSPQQPPEVEPLEELEESEQFVDFAEEPRVYEGSKPLESFSITFVDGVRRTECLVYIKDEETGDSFEGAFLSLGAGALRVEYGRLNMLTESLVEKRVSRILAIKGYAPIDELLGFKPLSVEGELSVSINRYMKEELEAPVALKVLHRYPTDLLVCDGTLSHRLRNTPCLGLIKSMKSLYMDRAHLSLLYELKVGQRSPIIKLHYQKRQEEKEKVDKYTWYIRLSPHGGLAGLARAELFPQKDFEEVIRLANLSASLLPLFASSSFQDRRAPQNLLPVGRLEKFLRLHLGHYRIIRRRIESFLLHA